MNFDQIVAALIAGEITEELLDTIRSMSIDDLKRVEKLMYAAQPYLYQTENVLKVLMHCGYCDGVKYPVVKEKFQQTYYDVMIGTYFLVDGKIYIGCNYQDIKTVALTMPNLRTKTHLLVYLHGAIYLDGVRYSHKRCVGIDIVVAESNPEQLKPENIFKTIHGMEYDQKLFLRNTHLEQLKEYDRVMNPYRTTNEFQKVNYILSIDNFERYPFSVVHTAIAKAIKNIKQATGIEKTRHGLAMSDEDLEKYKPYIQDDEFVAKVQLFKKYRNILGTDLGIFCKVFAPSGASPVSSNVSTSNTSTADAVASTSAAV